MAGSLAMKEALEQAARCLPARADHAVTVSVPEDNVGDVIGDLNSRRGRPLGMEPVGGMTEIKAEVPMAEMLYYAPDLRSITGGQGEYTMEFCATRRSPPSGRRRSSPRPRATRRPTEACGLGNRGRSLARTSAASTERGPGVATLGPP